MRKGCKPKAHLTLACIATTVECIEAGNVPACRWQPLCQAIQANIARPGETIDFRSPSDTQVRRLLDLDDYIRLAHEKEELLMQAEKQNLQFSCDISPMMKRECRNYLHAYPIMYVADADANTYTCC
jgi:hypothetical protein